MVQVRRSGGEAGVIIKPLWSYYSAISYCCSCSLERRVPGVMLLPRGIPAASIPCPWAQPQKGAFSQGISRLTSSLLNETCDTGPTCVFL